MFFTHKFSSGSSLFKFNVWHIRHEARLFILTVYVYSSGKILVGNIFRQTQTLQRPHGLIVYVRDLREKALKNGVIHSNFMSVVRNGAYAN